VQSGQGIVALPGYKIHVPSTKHWYNQAGVVAKSYPLLQLINAAGAPQYCFIATPPLIGGG
jgi:hypothetical protein